jgi:hypothetical protein
LLLKEFTQGLLGGFFHFPVFLPCTAGSVSLTAMGVATIVRFVATPFFAVRFAARSTVAQFSYLPGEQAKGRQDADKTRAVALTSRHYLIHSLLFAVVNNFDIY